MLLNLTTRQLIDDYEARIVRFGRNDTSLQSWPNVVSFKRFNYAALQQQKIGKKKEVCRYSQLVTVDRVENA
jgi:hypothetical protein